ncbi:TPA: hypothetical protein ACH3X2_013332 [Trebouxia sp. C0005]
MGKPHGDGRHIPWSPWPLRAPPTIVQMPAPSTHPDEVTQHVLSPDLTSTQQNDVQELLQTYADRFATGSSTGRTNIVTHRIDTGDTAPIKSKPHRQSA